MKFKQILDEVGKDVLTEESKQAIVEAFENQINEKVEERVQLAVENVTKQIDDDHAQKLEKLLETIDADHTNKFKQVLVKVDKDYGSKLQKVIEKYEGMLEKEAVDFREQLVSEISNYLELYLDKKVPVKQIYEACENVQAKKMVEKVKQIISVDEEFITDNIREALAEGKNTIDTLRQELAEAVKTNVRINQDLKASNADLVLEKKTINLPDEKKQFVRRLLGKKDAEYIKENFEYVVEMFEQQESEQAEVITEQAREDTISKNIDTPESVINEEVVSEGTQQTAPVNGYLDELKRQS